MAAAKAIAIHKSRAFGMNYTVVWLFTTACWHARTAVSDQKPKSYKYPVVFVSNSSQRVSKAPKKLAAQQLVVKTLAFIWVIALGVFATAMPVLALGPIKQNSVVASPLAAPVAASNALGHQILRSSGLGAQAPLVQSDTQTLDIDEIVDQLDTKGYYRQAGSGVSEQELKDLAARASKDKENWFFVALAENAPTGFENDIYTHTENEGHVFVLLKVTENSETFTDLAMSPTLPVGVEDDIREEFVNGTGTLGEFLNKALDIAGVKASSTSGSSSSSNSSEGPSAAGTGIVLLACGGGGYWWWRRSKKKKEKRFEAADERAQELAEALKDEISELANDVLVLGDRVRVADIKEATNYYRTATASYNEITDEIPDTDEIDRGDVELIRDAAIKVQFARWQMDAAEALVDGEPIPEKPKFQPKVLPSPVPQPPVAHQPTPQAAPSRAQYPMPRQAPRPRRRSAASSAGGLLLDVLIGAMASNHRRGRRNQGRGGFGGSRGTRSSGGFGGFGSSSRRSTGSTRSPGRSGGVFGSSSGRSSGSSSRSSSRRSSSSSGSARRSGARRSAPRRSSGGRSRRSSSSRSRRR